MAGSAPGPSINESAAMNDTKRGREKAHGRHSQHGGWVGGRGGNSDMPRWRISRPVTAAMLENPDPQAWLMARGNQGAWGYSALGRIGASDGGRRKPARA
jgi:hypothetical protein